MPDILTLLSTVWGWIKSAKFAVPLAGVLFIIAILVYGKGAGLSTEQIWAGGILVIVLAVGLSLLNNLAHDELLKRIVTWVLAGIFLVAAGRIVWRYSNSPDQVHRIPYTEPYIAYNCGPPTTMLTSPNIAVNASHDAKLLASLNKFWEWVSDGLEWYRNQNIGPDNQPISDKTQRAVVLLSKKPFGDRYDTINGTIHLNDNIKIEEGAIFLKSIHGDHVQLRQMACKCDITSQEVNGADFSLFEPDPEEELLVILRLRSRNGQEVNSDCDSYGLSLKVTKQ